MTVFHVDNQGHRKPAEVPGIYVSLLADVSLPLRPGQGQICVHHQKLMIEPGTEDRYHVHKQTWEIFTVEAGQVEALVDGKTVFLDRGDVFLARPGVAHRFANRTTETVTITETRIDVDPADRHPAAV
ncbi:MAG: cupin domain-containing protein [Actinobacteria bacterium]|nr:cupin domain-containing protein [Actinomycetota bacterium]